MVGAVASASSVPSAPADSQVEKLDTVERNLLGLSAVSSKPNTWLKGAGVLLGDAPIELLSPLIKLVLPKTDGHNAAAITGGMALAVDGAVRGLFLTKGLLRKPLEKAIPFLARKRAQGTIGAKMLSGVKSARTVLRYGGYAISVGLGSIRAARAVLTSGSPEALLTTTDGRSGALHAIGGVLLMVPHPATRLLGSAAYIGAVVNDFATDDQVVPR